MSMGSWWSFNRTNVEAEKNMGGVYELGNASRAVVYIGGSARVRERLLEHLAGGDACIRNHTTYYRVNYHVSYRIEERRRYDAYIASRRSSPLCNDRRS